MFSLSFAKAYIYDIKFKIMNNNTKLLKFKAFEIGQEQQREVKGGMKSKDNLLNLGFLAPKMSIWGEVEVRRPILGGDPVGGFVRPNQNSPVKKRMP